MADRPRWLSLKTTTFFWLLIILVLGVILVACQSAPMPAPWNTYSTGPAPPTPPPTVVAIPTARPSLLVYNTVERLLAGDLVHTVTIADVQIDLTTFPPDWPVVGVGTTAWIGRNGEMMPDGTAGQLHFWWADPGSPSQADVMDLISDEGRRIKDESSFVVGRWSFVGPKAQFPFLALAIGDPTTVVTWTLRDVEDVHAWLEEKLTASGIDLAGLQLRGQFGPVKTSVVYNLPLTGLDLSGGYVGEDYFRFHEYITATWTMNGLYAADPALQPVISVAGHPLHLHGYQPGAMLGGHVGRASAISVTATIWPLSQVITRIGKLRPGALYSVTVADVAERRIKVEATFRGMEPGPNAAAMLDGFGPYRGFGDWVSDLKATDAEGHPLALTHERGEPFMGFPTLRWRLDVPDDGVVRLRYTVTLPKPEPGIYISLGPILEPGFATLFPYAYIITPAAFLSDPDAPVNIATTYVLPEGWAVQAEPAGSSMSDWLTGAAVLGQYRVLEGSEGNVRAVVLLSPNAPEELAEQMAALPATFLEQVRVFGGAPDGSDTWEVLAIVNVLDQFGEGGGGHGMPPEIRPGEARPASALYVALGSQVSVETALRVPAHEAFHIWTGGALAFESLPPFGNDPDTIWLHEGFTEFYTWETLRRAGAISEDQFWGEMRYKMGVYRDSPLAETTTFAEAASCQDERDCLDLVYEKGALLALMLDRQIRRETDGVKSLDDVMWLLYREHNSFQGAGPLSRTDIQAAIEEVTGRDPSAGSGQRYEEFFARYVTGTDWLDLGGIPELGSVGLELGVRGTLADLPGTIGVAWKNLDTGEAGSVNGDNEFFVASAFKTAVLVELLRQAEAGKLDLDERVTVSQEAYAGSEDLLAHFTSGAQLTLHDLAILMIVFSDNTATDLLIRRVGMDRINAMLAAHGFQVTRVNGLTKDAWARWLGIPPEEAARLSNDEVRRRFDALPQPPPVTPETFAGLWPGTPNEYVRLYELLGEGELLGPQATADALSILKLWQGLSVMPALFPWGLEAAHKPGGAPGTVTDAGIIYTPAGPIALAIFANDLPEGPKGIPRVMPALQDVARLVVKHMN